MLNKYSSDKKDTITQLHNDVFYDHFARLNQNRNENNQDNQFDINHLPENNDVIIQNFTVEEINKSVLKLKK